VPRAAVTTAPAATSEAAPMAAASRTDLCIAIPFLKEGFLIW
jgi:hypothetical protein